MGYMNWNHSRLTHSSAHPQTEELASAEPAMKAAAAAVDVLSKPMLTELKNLKVRGSISHRAHTIASHSFSLFSDQSTLLSFLQTNNTVAPNRRGLGDDGLPHLGGAGQSACVFRRGEEEEGTCAR